MQESEAVSCVPTATGAGAGGTAHSHTVVDDDAVDRALDTVELDLAKVSFDDPDPEPIVPVARSSTGLRKEALEALAARKMTSPNTSRHSTGATLSPNASSRLSTASLDGSISPSGSPVGSPNSTKRPTWMSTKGASPRSSASSLAPVAQDEISDKELRVFAPTSGGAVAEDKTRKIEGLRKQPTPRTPTWMVPKASKKA